MQVEQLDTPYEAPVRRLQELVGAVLGEYRLERCVADSGTSTLFEGWDLLTKRRVAVKVFDLRSPHGEELRQRFKREVAQLAGLRHPHVARLIDHGIRKETAFLVMEHVEGEKLSHHLRYRGPMSLETFVPVAIQILRAVGHAHRQGVLLRDLNPDNIMLCSTDGAVPLVKLTDFGLARFENESDKLTDERLVGTVQYLAPEQIRKARLDLRVDVYVLGLLFYQMLSGVLPHEADNFAALMLQKVEVKPRSLKEARADAPKLPAALVSLIAQCLETRRDDRPKDANAIATRLLEILPARLFRSPTSLLSSVAISFDDEDPIHEEPTRILGSTAHEREPRVARDTKTRSRRRSRPWFMLLGLVAAGLTFGASGLEPPDLAEVQEFYREVVHLVSVPEPARTNEFRRPRAAPTPAPRESNSVLACEGPEHEKPEHEKPAHEEPEHEEPEVDPAPSLPHSKARRAERSSSKREIVTQEQLEPRPEPFVPEKAAPPVGLVELSTAASSGGDVDAEASSSDSEPSDEGPNPFFAP